MSKLDHLIQGFCPDGVEFFEFKNIVDKSLGGGTPSKAVPNYWEGDIPWASVKDIVRSKDYIADTIDHITADGLKHSSSNLIPKDWLVMCTRINPGLCTIAGREIAINQDLRGFQFRHGVNVRFIWYYFQTIVLIGKGTTVKGISIIDLDKTLVPIPPLEVQEEIVRILDKFTILEAELETELEARLLQYNHYRNHLLDFSDNVEFKKLDEIIISLKTGLNPRKNFILNPPDALNYYVTVREITDNRIQITEKTDKVNDQALKLINGRSNLDMNDILFSGTGTVGRTALIEQKPSNWDIKEGVYVVKPDIEKVKPKFLMYVLNSSRIIELYKKKIVGSPVISLPMHDLRKLRIPVPPIPVQEKIVSILDRFEAMVHDLKNGLPAEIAARHKQYEYYRNQLLTFKEKSA